MTQQISNKVQQSRLSGDRKVLPSPNSKAWSVKQYDPNSSIRINSPKIETRYQNSNNHLDVSHDIRSVLNYSRPMRNYPQELPPESLQTFIKLLEEDLESATINYENVLQSQRKASSQRSDFLLYLIQSVKTRHNQEIESYKSQLTSLQQERQQARNLEKQMQNIGEGVDSILEESKKLTLHNQYLKRELLDQDEKQKELDDQIQSYNKQISDSKLKVDDFERAKIKWNRKRKDLIELIEETEDTIINQTANHIKQITSSVFDPKIQLQLQGLPMSEIQCVPLSQSGKIKVVVCPDTGIEEDNCDHCQLANMEQLFSKYKAQD